MTQEPMETASSNLSDRLETVIAILLGVAAILVAVTGYQASLRDGDSISSFNDGIRSVNDANGFYNDATQQTSRDQALFLEYAKAVQADEDDLSSYLHDSIMDDNLRGAVDEWSKDDNDAETPLDTAAYANEAAAEGERLTKLTDRQFAEARNLDKEGDKYSLVGVIVASSLFFLGIAGVMSRIRIKVAGLGLGAVTLAVSIVMWLAV